MKVKPQRTQRITKAFGRWFVALCSSRECGIFISELLRGSVFCDQIFPCVPLCPLWFYPPFEVQYREWYPFSLQLLSLEIIRQQETQPA